MSVATVLKNLGAAENRQDYIDRALIEYAAASYHFEQAGHMRYQACVENNVAMLFWKARRFADAHDHLDRAQMLFTRLKDDVHLAQVDETRARVMLAEGRVVDAEKGAGTFVAVGRIGAAKPPRDCEENVAHPDRRGPSLVPVHQIARLIQLNSSTDIGSEVG